MSYESRLYVVRECNFSFLSDNGKVWAEVVGMIDLSKCYGIKEVFMKEANAYIYAEDGNTRIEKDRYDEPLTVAELDEVIKCLKKIIKETDYHRAKVALQFLKAVQKGRQSQKFRQKLCNFQFP